MSILLDTERTLDVVTVETTVLYAISVQTLKSMLGDKYRDILFVNCLINCFQNSSCFNKINTHILENSYRCFKIVDFAKGQVVLEKGETMSNKIIAIIEGNLINVKYVINFLGFNQ
jgi:CRP-like cAMP-binding protein